MVRITWYIICILALILDDPQNSRFSCNQPYVSVLPVNLDSIESAKKSAPYIKVNFSKAALKGADEVEVANSYQAISKDKVLGGIFGHSTEYLEDVRQFLSSSKYTTDQKIIAICLIQSLPLSDYLPMCKYAGTLFENNIIEEEVLMWIIAPNFDNNQIIARNYQNPEVIAVLKEIRKINGLSRTTKRVIDQILSGDEMKFL